MSLIEYLKSLEAKTIPDKEFGELAFRIGTPASVPDIKATEAELGLKLPPSFKEFLIYAGAAEFFDLLISGPTELYQFDAECWEMAGFVPFAKDSVGDHFAFNPNVGRAEYPVFKCSHDPLGYGKVADDFAEWLRIHVGFLENRDKGEPDKSHPYRKAKEKIRETYERYKASQPKKWWQFWR